MPRGPLLALIVGLFAVSLAGPFIVLSGIGPFALPAWRLLAVAAVLLPLAWRGLRADLATLDRGDRLRLLAAGLLYGAHFAAFTLAFKHTTKESAVLLLGGQPLIGAAAGALLLGERVTRPMVVSSLVGIAGLVVFVGEHVTVDPHHLVGDGLVLLCEVLLAISYTIARRLRPRMELTSWLASLYGSGGLLCLAVALVARDPLWGYPADAWGWLAGAVVISTLIGHSCYQWAVRFVPVFYVNVMSLGEPVVAVAVMSLLRDRYPALQASQVSGQQAVGAALLIGGVALGLTWRSPPATDATPVSDPPPPA